jgi:hypothetical protein
MNMLLQANKVLTKEVADHFTAQGYEFKPSDDGEGFVLSGWKGTPLYQLHEDYREPVEPIERPVAMTVSQLIERLIELREAGYGDCEVIYNDDCAHVEVTDIRVNSEYDGAGTPSVIMID